MKDISQITCPVCASLLDHTEDGLSARCENGHSFDFAKHGYLNLLLSKQKKSKHPGDDQNMINARKSFLNKGFYNTVANFLYDIVIPHIEEQYDIVKTRNNKLTYTDLACGEGFYTQFLHSKLTEYLEAETAKEQRSESKQKLTKLITTGIDISAPGIKTACKRDKSIRWIVASASNNPLQNKSQDLVTGLFFHFDLNEVSRILRTNGIFVTFNTGPQHLIELRSIVYDELKPAKSVSFRSVPSDLHHQTTMRHMDEITLNSEEDIMNLLMMTPHYWRAKKNKKDSLFAQKTLKLTLDIQADIFIRQ